MKVDFGGGRLEAGLEGALNIIDGASGCDDDQDEDRDDGKNRVLPRRPLVRTHVPLKNAAAHVLKCHNDRV